MKRMDCDDLEDALGIPEGRPPGELIRLDSLFEAVGDDQTTTQGMSLSTLSHFNATRVPEKVLFGAIHPR